MLDAFDAWRRATGVPAGASNGEAAAPARRRASLAAHLERTAAALTARRAGAATELDDALERAVRALDRLRAAGRALRGDARERILEQLRELDSRLVQEVRSVLPRAEEQALALEAEASLAPFRQRMSDAEWTRARAAAVDRAIRAALKLPVIAME